MFYGEKFESVNAFIEQLHEYIYYYNNERTSRKLKGMSPVGYNANIEKSLDLTMYQTQLKEVERKIENLMNAICDGFYNANSQQKMLELNEAKDKQL